jgi:hypothetical protein
MNGDKIQTERNKFGRTEDEEEDTSPELRELDEALDYGVFGDIIAKYISIRREVHHKNMIRKRKRHGQDGAEDENENNSSKANEAQRKEEAELDWTNEKMIGEIQLAPGQVVETDLDVLEERIRKRAAIHRLVWNPFILIYYPFIASRR